MSFIYYHGCCACRRLEQLGRDAHKARTETMGRFKIFGVGIGVPTGGFDSICDDCTAVITDLLKATLDAMNPAWRGPAGFGRCAACGDASALNITLPIVYQIELGLRECCAKCTKTICTILDVAIAAMPKAAHG